jgi:hypothetical protein
VVENFAVHGCGRRRRRREMEKRKRLERTEAIEVKVEGRWTLIEKRDDGKKSLYLGRLKDKVDVDRAMSSCSAFFVYISVYLYQSW